MIKIAKSWYNLLLEEFHKPYFIAIQNFLKVQYNSKNIYPKVENIFNALNYTMFEDVKVVIFGQDPYHQPNQAHGLAFSVLDGVKKPPSLVNIFKEIENEFNYTCNPSGDLTRWAKQGVLLLNAVLTVEDSLPNSHKNIGWQNLTKKIVELLNQKDEQVIFVLWGKNAQEFEVLINKEKHIILKSAHPSPLSCFNGFFGNNHFIKINQILKNNNKKEIDWHW